jgi:hypothetical protein
VVVLPRGSDSLSAKCVCAKNVVGGKKRRLVNDAPAVVFDGVVSSSPPSSR